MASENTIENEKDKVKTDSTIRDISDDLAKD